MLTGERDAVESLAMFGVPLRISSSCMHGPPPPAVGVARAMRRHHEKKNMYFWPISLWLLYLRSLLSYGCTSSRA